MKLTERDRTFIKEQIKEVVKAIEKLTEVVKKSKSNIEQK